MLFASQASDAPYPKFVALLAVGVKFEMIPIAVAHAITSLCPEQLGAPGIGNRTMEVLVIVWLALLVQVIVPEPVQPLRRAPLVTCVPAVENGCIPFATACPVQLVRVSVVVV